MQVTLAHDYLTQIGGAERVALALTKIYPQAALYTAVHAPKQTFPQFNSVDVRTSGLQRFPTLRRDPRRALPFLARAWRQFHVDDADVVLASSSGWAHGIRVAPGIRKVVYCHNPPRWLYQGNEYLQARHERFAMSLLAPRLRRQDIEAALSADAYIANSSVVAARIKKAYGITAVVINPPVDVNVDGPLEPPPGVEPGFWLTVSRPRSYKNTQLVVDAVTHLMGERLVVVGGGGPAPAGPAPANPRLHELGRVSEDTLRWLYRNCRGLVSMSYEDFGLTPIEANAFGKPAITLRAGGFLDSVEPGVSGAFIEGVSASSAAATLSSLPVFDPAAITAHARTFSLQSFARRIDAVVSGAAVVTDLADAADEATIRLPRQLTVDPTSPPVVPGPR